MKGLSKPSTRVVNPKPRLCPSPKPKTVPTPKVETVEESPTRPIKTEFEPRKKYEDKKKTNKTYNN